MVREAPRCTHQVGKDDFSLFAHFFLLTSVENSPVAIFFAPVGWALCNGQLLVLSQCQALYTILGTTRDGDDRTTFGCDKAHAVLIKN